MRAVDIKALLPGLHDSGSSWDYALLVDEIDQDGFACESYGLAVSAASGEERAAIRHITVNYKAALELLTRVFRGQVSPATLLDVVQDFLCE